MAESEGNKSSLRLKRNVSKFAFRGKERIFRTLGGGDETKDEIIDNYVHLVNKQQAQFQKFQHDMKKYLQSIMVMKLASKEFYDSLGEIYEDSWMGKDVLSTLAQTSDVLCADLHARMSTEVIAALQDHLTQCNEMKVKVNKRGRKLVDFDGARRNLNTLQNAKKVEEAKLLKAKESVSQTHETYEMLNSQLHDELPDLHDARVTLCTDVISRVAKAEKSYYDEMSEVRTKLLNVAKNVRDAFDGGEYRIQRLHSPMRTTLSTPQSQDLPTLPADEVRGHERRSRGYSDRSSRSSGDRKHSSSSSRRHGSSSHRSSRHDESPKKHRDSSNQERHDYVNLQIGVGASDHMTNGHGQSETPNSDYAAIAVEENGIVFSPEKKPFLKSINYSDSAKPLPLLAHPHASYSNAIRPEPQSRAVKEDKPRPSPRLRIREEMGGDAPAYAGQSAAPKSPRADDTKPHAKSRAAMTLPPEKVNESGDGAVMRSKSLERNRGAAPSSAEQAKKRRSLFSFGGMDKLFSRNMYQKSAAGSDEKPSKKKSGMKLSTTGNSSTTSGSESTAGHGTKRESLASSGQNASPTPVFAKMEHSTMKAPFQDEGERGDAGWSPDDVYDDVRHSDDDVSRSDDGMRHSDNVYDDVRHSDDDVPRSNDGMRQSDDVYEDVRHSDDDVPRSNDGVRHSDDVYDDVRHSDDVYDDVRHSREKSISMEGDDKSLSFEEFPRSDPGVIADGAPHSDSEGEDWGAHRGGSVPSDNGVVDKVKYNNDPVLTNESTDAHSDVTGPSKSGHGSPVQIGSEDDDDEEGRYTLMMLGAQVREVPESDELYVGHDARLAADDDSTDHNEQDIYETIISRDRTKTIEPANSSSSDVTKLTLGNSNIINQALADKETAGEDDQSCYEPMFFTGRRPANSAGSSIDGSSVSTQSSPALSPSTSDDALHRTTSNYKAGSVDVDLYTPAVNQPSSVNQPELTGPLPPKETLLTSSRSSSEASDFPLYDFAIELPAATSKHVITPQASLPASESDVAGGHPEGSGYFEEDEPMYENREINRALQGMMEPQADDDIYDIPFLSRHPVVAAAVQVSDDLKVAEANGGSPIYEVPPDDTRELIGVGESEEQNRPISKREEEKSLILPPHYMYTTQAMYPYNGSDDDELSFVKGDVIYVVEFPEPEEQDDGWQMGILRSTWEDTQSTSSMGVFPENFTRKI